jgi:hypothetical protein
MQATLCTAGVGRTYQLFGTHFAFSSILCR